MICPQCRAVNESSSAFCSNCGTSLGRSAPGTGSRNSLGQPTMAPPAQPGSAPGSSGPPWAPAMPGPPGSPGAPYAPGADSPSFGRYAPGPGSPSSGPYDPGLSSYAPRSGPPSAPYAPDPGPYAPGPGSRPGPYVPSHSSPAGPNSPGHSSPTGPNSPGHSSPTGPNSPGHSSPSGPYSPGHSSPSGAFRLDLRRLGRVEQAVGGASLVVLISLFLPWYGVSVLGASYTVSGTSAHWYLVVTLLLAIVLIGYLVLRSGWDKPPLDLPIAHAPLLLIGTGLQFLLVFIGFLDKPAGLSWEIGAYLALIAAAAAAAPVIVPAVRSWQDSR